MSKRRIVRKIKNAKPYQCEKCDKRFKDSRSLAIHNNKVPDCDEEHICDKCGQLFPEKRYLQSHLKRKTPCAPDTVPVISEDNEDNTCYKCNKTYANKYSLKKHQSICKANPQVLLQLINKQQEEIELLKQNQGNIVVNQTYNDNRVMNNTVVVVFGKEDLQQIIGTELAAKLLLDHDIDEVIPKLIAHVHCNEDLPQYQNVYIPGDDASTALVYGRQGNNSTWVRKDATDVSKQLIANAKQVYLPEGHPNDDILKLSDDTRIKTFDFWKHTNRVESKEETVDARVEDVKNVLKSASQFHED